ncbi:MAG: 30S ribosomal protein S1 [Deltaproteobacteria bacterium]|nr:30S ribosomal protein S1 [Deltaproteobacteria bacterium]
MSKGTDEISESGFSQTENTNAAIWNDPDGFTDEFPADSIERGSGTEEDVSFMEMFEESMKSIQEGKIVSGEILQIDDEFVLVDIGYKSEGQIRINEFKDLEGNLKAQVGDTVEVLLVRKEDKDGNIVLSKEKAARVKIWDDIEKAYKDNETVKGKIISRVKGGLSVDVGLQAFLPGSQADLRPVKDLDTLVGVEHDFKIIKYERRQGNIVLSRRAVLEVERAEQREKVLENLEEGAVVDGAVTNITDYGLFIDLGGIDGLVHVTNIAWSKTGHPSELYQIGDQITVKVLSFDREKERVSLGIKQLTPDPWTGIEEKYPVGTQVSGRIATLKKYGAFVELEEGVEGLVHISEMSWTRKVMHPSELFRVGDTVETIVLSMDVAKKRISLSVKQLEPNPWDVITEEYPIGAIIEGKIKNITDFGVFVGIDKGIDGLVHISDISWTKQIKHPSELYKKGDDVRAVILRIDKENEHFSLGIKHLTPDPWNEIPEKYKPGTRVTGKVTNITDFGLFVELEEGIEGLIHVSQLPKGRQDAKDLKDFEVGNEIDAEVVNVSQKDKRIGLSIRKLQESPEKKVYTNYVNNQEKATSNLGALLKEKMMDMDSDEEPSAPSTDNE